MDYDVWWAQTAERDRDRIVDYLLYELDSPSAARHFLDELDAGLDLVSSNPELFAVSKEQRLSALGYRPYRFMNYIALHKFDDGVVKVARIVHMRQNYARLV